MPDPAKYNSNLPETWDVRPIACGETLRRLASKCVCSLVKTKALQLFHKQQYVVAYPGGLEFIVHSVREAVTRNSNSDNFVVLKVDCENAFNLVSRTVILEEVRKHLPYIFPWVYWCYSNESVLFHPLGKIRSRSGVQQGDAGATFILSCLK